MRKILLLLSLIFFAHDSFAFTLPDNINEWKCTNEYILPLIPEADSKDLGRIVYKDYSRENSNEKLQIILTEGQGTGNLYIPDKTGNYKGLMPSDSEYKLLDISGHKSILERYEYLPLVLAVSVSNDIVMTIESGSLNEEGIINFAEIILREKIQ